MAARLDRDTEAILQGTLDMGSAGARPVQAKVNRSLELKNPRVRSNTAISSSSLAVGVRVPLA